MFSSYLLVLASLLILMLLQMYSEAGFPLTCLCLLACWLWCFCKCTLKPTWRPSAQRSTRQSKNPVHVLHFPRSLTCPRPLQPPRPLQELNKHDDLCKVPRPLQKLNKHDDLCRPPSGGGGAGAALQLEDSGGAGVALQAAAPERLSAATPRW